MYHTKISIYRILQGNFGHFAFIPYRYVRA